MARVTAQVPLKEVSIRTTPYSPPSLILRADQSLVETSLAVRDGNGRAVGGLQASDLEVRDNGEPRQIVSFSEVRLAAAPTGARDAETTHDVTSNQPAPPATSRFATFFFDDFHIPPGSMSFVKQGAKAFIANGILPGDHLSIVTASGQGDLDFTTNAKLFADRLEHLSAHPRPVSIAPCGVSPIDSYIFLHNLDGQIIEQAIAAATSCASCGPSTMPSQCRLVAVGIAQTAASTTWEQMEAISHDTMYALGFAAKVLAQMKGSRILVLTSSGFLLRPGTPPELESFIDAAVRANIVVHAIGAQGLDPQLFGTKTLLKTSLPLAPLENIVNGTGGHYFKNTNDLASAMKAAVDPEVSYSLAFSAGPPDGKFHTLKIRYKDKQGRDLQYRPGYYSPDPKKEVSARARMDDAVFSKTALREIPVSVSLSAGQARGTVIPISVRLTVDAKALRFVKANGRHMQQIAFLTVLLDSNGAFITGEESIMELALTNEKLASINKTGLTAIATLPAYPGVYQVRTIVREGMKGSLAAATTLVEVRPK